MPSLAAGILVILAFISLTEAFAGPRWKVDIDEPIKPPPLPTDTESTPIASEAATPSQSEDSIIEEEVVTIKLKSDYLLKEQKKTKKMEQRGENEYVKIRNWPYVTQFNETVFKNT